MARCGCSGECNCVIIAGDCITVAGSGNPGSPYSIAAEVDPDPTNQLACGDPGLFVPPPSIEVADTDCVNLDGTGFPGDPVTATLILDPEDCNLLKCNVGQGLDVLLHTLDSDCVDLEGCGTLDSPLIASITPSPDPGNTIVCRNNGLYIPATGAGAIDIYGHMDLFGPFLSAAGVGVVQYNPWPFNRSLYDIGGIVDLPNSRFLAPASGWYYIEAQWEDNAFDNSFQTGLFGGYFQQLVGMSVSSVTPTFIPGGSLTQDRLVENPHRYRLAEVRYLSIGDTVDFFWRITNTTGGIINAMSFNPVPPAPGSSTENYAVIARIGV